MDIHVKPANGHAGSLKKEDVWGSYDERSNTLLSKGMIVAKGLPGVSRYFSEKDRQRRIPQYPDVCPIWKDQLPYKSVTVLCPSYLITDVSYWLEYVHGGGSISDVKELPDGMVALRSDYKCW